MFTSLSRGSIESGFKKYRSARVGEPSTANLLVYYKGGVSGGNPVAVVGSNGTGSSITEGTDASSKYIAFDGQTNYSNIDTGFGANVGYPTLTASAWIKPTTQPTTHPTGIIVNNCSFYAFDVVDFPFFLNFSYPDQSVNMSLSYGNDYTADIILNSGINSVLRNEWTHVACSYTPSGSAKLYVNGTLVASQSGVGTVSTSFRNFFWGRASFPYSDGSTLYKGYAFNGQMDEMRLYSRQLSDSEVNDIYLLGRG